MASTASDLIKFEKMATGEKSGTWGTLANQAMSRLEESVHDITNISLNSLSGANYTLDDTQYTEHNDGSNTSESHARVVKATGTLNSAEKIIVPLRNHLYLIWNATSGAYAVTVGGASGDAIEVPQGYLMEVVCDGTNCEAAGPAMSVAGVQRVDTIEFGHATDTTLTRASAGDVNIEGNIVYRAGGTDVPVTDGGTGAGTFTNGGVLLGSGTSAITAMAALSDGEFIVGNGTTDPVAESGATVRTSLGLGTFAVEDTNAVPAMTLAGAITGGDQQVSAINLVDYGEVTVAHGVTGATETLDISAGAHHTATIDEACTFTFSNPTASDELSSFTLSLTNGGAFTVTWPGSVDWPGASAPSLTASGLDVLVFMTYDGGTIWHGMIASADSS